jgi:hypothetical protein
MVEVFTMRIAVMALALAGAAVLAGCSKMVCLNPFVTDDEATVDPRLIGVWQDKDGDDTYIVKQAGKAYAITIADKSSATKLEARMLDIGGAKILDVTAKDEAPFQIAVHVPMRIWLEGSTLRMAFLDADWIRQLAVQELGAQNDDRTLTGASGSAVRNFLVKYGADSRALGEETSLLRVQ